MNKTLDEAISEEPASHEVREDRSGFRPPHGWDVGKVADFPLLWPLSLVIGASILVVVTGADLAITRSFYQFADPSTHLQPGWIHADKQPWRWIDEQPVRLVIAMVAASIAGMVIGYFSPSRRRWMVAGMFILAVMAIAPGLMVNGIFKGAWGRPRPTHVAEFGGQAEYQPFWQIGNDPINHKGFPSGHGTMAFTLMVPAFLFGTRHRKYALLWLTGAICVASAVGLARIAQGAHFTSDILMSGALVYAVAIGFRPLFFEVDRSGGSVIDRLRCGRQSKEDLNDQDQGKTIAIQKAA
ncbi:phosphatase PAP2 family protein [Stratiformator vulcanicus]|uniref:PAP2 superfamily protein n=1 Tax=Stratiformator vulcanicus TaxID=2527980 RepID=A0A517QZR6_9PLAN|nr:phosphatase PAP2 family protein [Stratiformator vulcanicus]QDT37147.1 PAP2 superfamily protein [Stratiformator vulcanicus]